MPLVLRPFIDSDEAAARAGHEQMAGWEFLLQYDEEDSWATWLDHHERLASGESLPEGFVQSAFLAAVVNGHLVGRVSIRFALNDFLFRYGGHIGYGVLPQHRRQGYATEILRQALERLRLAGVERALVTCFDGKIGSAAVIEANGGKLENIVPYKDDQLRRYWITTGQ